MKFINMYLIGYFILVVGICLALWQSGALNNIAPVWIGIGALVAVGIGIMMAVSSGKPEGTTGTP
jgi:drug/metabolite transporter (DMT)-like permease